MESEAQDLELVLPFSICINKSQNPSEAFLSLDYEKARQDEPQIDLHAPFCQLVGSTNYLFSLPIPYGKEGMNVQSETLESDEHEVNPWFYYSLVVWRGASPTFSQLNALFVKWDYGSYPIRQNIST